MSQDNIQYIDTFEQLESFCEQLHNEDYIAVDTEFLRDRTYYPKLCLVQIASSKHLCCIDPLKIDDLRPLKDLLSNPAIIKIFHAARQDIETFHYSFQCLPVSIYDTQIAASFLGLGEQIAYTKLVEHYTEVRLAKTQSRTDWEQRPLSEQQVSYAADDVKYLYQIYPIMISALEEKGRQTWVAEEVNELLAEDLYVIDKSKLWQRVSGSQKIRGQALAVLQGLAEWREEQAQKNNKPRKHIIQDHLLTAMCTQAPKSESQLQRVRGLAPQFINKYASSVLKTVEQALAVPKEDWPVKVIPPRLNPEQESLADTAMAILKLNAQQNNINVSTLANRRDIDKVLTGVTDVPLLKTWRRDIAGQDLLDFMQGKITLSCENNQLKINNM